MSPGSKVCCVLCHLSRETEITGALSTKEQVTAHQNCLLYSSGLWCTDSPEADDLFGFAVEHVLNEVKRGNKLTCSKCKKKGATVGCEITRCKKSYHYPCAVEDEAETIEDQHNGKYGLYCCNHSKQRKQSKGSVNGLASSSTKPTTSREAGSSKVCCLACEKTKGNISLENLSTTIVVLYCDKHVPSTYKMKVHAGSSAHSSDSNSSSSAIRLASKRRRRLSDGDEEMEKTSTKRKSREATYQMIPTLHISDDSSDSDHNEPNTELAPLSSDLDESANSVQEHDFIRKNTESPTGATSGNQQESRDGNEDETVLFDDESQSLLPAETREEPQSPPTTTAEHLSTTTSTAHLKVTLITSENEDQECSPEQKSPVYGPDQLTAGPSVPQQGSTGLLPSPDLSKSCSVTGSPPCTSTATFPGPPETTCVPTLSSSPFPSPVAHSSQSCIDSVSFWKCCNAAGCTQAIFADFINDMNNISNRIQSNQASQEDYDLALKVIADTGKLTELVVKQQEELQRKQTELKKATAAMKDVISALSLPHQRPL